MPTHTSECRRCVSKRLGSWVACAGLLLLLITPTATGGQVGALVQFTNGTVADANEINQNFGMIRTAVNDNDTRITALENAGGGLDLDGFGGTFTSAIIPVAGAGGTADIRPPAGQVWIIDVIAGNAGSNVIVGYSDGTNSALVNNFSGFGLRGISLPASNALFLRILNNGAAVNIYYSARRIAGATVVGSVDSVANGAGQDFRPPAGQDWLVAVAYSTSGNLTFTDGMIDTGISMSIRTVDAFQPWFAMENARYLRFDNTSGSTQTAAVVGILKP